MKCPKCRLEEMNSEAYEEMQVERCPVCRGLYLDRGQLEAMLKKKLGSVADNIVFAPTPEALDEATAHCFRCDKDMELVKGPFDVFVNWCKSCGSMFLDPGELATIQRIPEEMKRDPSKED
jgi:Zn-finger nucleic acid-binding protein